MMQFAARTARRFTYRSRSGGRRMFWKLSIDLSRPLEFPVPDIPERENGIGPVRPPLGRRAACISGTA